MPTFEEEVISGLERYYKIGDKALQKMEDVSLRVLENDYRIALKKVKSDMAEMVEKYPTYDEMIAYKRLDKLSASIDDTISKLIKDNGKKLNGFLQMGVAGGYNTELYTLEAGSYGNITFASMNEQNVALNKMNPYQRLTWVDPLTENGAVTVKRLNSAISQGLIEGAGYTKIATAMSVQMGYSYGRMETIARTEIHKAQMFGRNLGFIETEKSDFSVSKVWITTGANDDRVRPNHLAMNEKKAKEFEGEYKFTFTTMNGSTIKVDGAGLTNTTDDINCRCSLITIFDDIDELTENAGYEPPSYDEWVDRNSKTTTK